MNKEYFGEDIIYNGITISNFPICLYRQQRDWTCAYACIRTLLSGVGYNIGEDELTQGKIPGPRYSKDIHNELRGILEKYNCMYGYKDKLDEVVTPSIAVHSIIKLLQEGYYIMTESMLNYDHWVVVLGYCIPNKSVDIDEHCIIFYDPYFNKVRIQQASELIAMWISGEHEKNNVKFDYIAIK